VSLAAHRQNRFPSVLLQPLGHLSALESTTCGRSRRDYRTRRCFPAAFSDPVSIQRVRHSRDSASVEIVSDLLMSPDHLRRFSPVGCGGRFRPKRLAAGFDRTQTTSVSWRTGCPLSRAYQGGKCATRRRVSHGRREAESETHSALSTRRMPRRSRKALRRAARSSGVGVLATPSSQKISPLHRHKRSLLLT
jgi:hypothetical protein